MCNVCEESIWYCEKDKVWYMRIEESTWSTGSDGLLYQDIPIRFCYRCGREYVAERTAWLLEQENE